MRQNLKISHDNFLQHPFRYITCNHSIIRSHITLQLCLRSTLIGSRTNRQTDISEGGAKKRNVQSEFVSFKLYLGHFHGEFNMQSSLPIEFTARHIHTL
jgi:hypothetical protein